MDKDKGKTKPRMVCFWNAIVKKVGCPFISVLREIDLSSSPLQGLVYMTYDPTDEARRHE